MNRIRNQKEIKKMDLPIIDCELVDGVFEPVENNHE